MLQSGALSGAAAFREYWTLESDFLNGLCSGTVVLLASQQAFPAMRQAQPKFAIVLIAGIRGQLSALLDLVLEEIGCFKHSITQTKRPARRGFYASQNAAAPELVPAVLQNAALNAFRVGQHRYWRL